MLVLALVIEKIKGAVPPGAGKSISVSAFSYSSSAANGPLADLV
jgi:hypothetical protein